MSYSISISGHTDKASVEEIAEEGRKFVKALDGVTAAWLSTDNKSIDLTKEPAAAAEESST